jgi:radical SAM superfamily enzyme
MNKFNEISLKHIKFTNRVNVLSNIIDTERKCFMDTMQIVSHMLNDLPEEKSNIYGKQIQDILTVYRSVHQN